MNKDVRKIRHVGRFTVDEHFQVEKFCAENSLSISDLIRDITVLAVSSPDCLQISRPKGKAARAKVTALLSFPTIRRVMRCLIERTNMELDHLRNLSHDELLKVAELSLKLRIAEREHRGDKENQAKKSHMQKAVWKWEKALDFLINK